MTHDVVNTTPVAERIREIVLDAAAEMDAWTEAYLYAAARAEHVRNGILPRLQAGENVVVDGNSQIRTQTKGGNGNCS